MDQNIPIEQYIYTTNPQKGGAFGIVAKSSNFDMETKNEIFSGYNSINSSIINRNQLEEQTSTSSVLKPGAKKGFFGRYKDSDYETKTIVTRNKIEIISETNSERLKSNGKDFRENPENAPYRIAKCKLEDGRILVVRAAAIGRVYSDIDQRDGNLFVHGIIFPAGTNLTNEDILKIDFKKGLPPQKNWNEYKIPETLDNKLITKTPKEKPSQQNAQKCIVPPALFTSAENIQKWEKESDKLNNSNNYDGATEQDIKELDEKIDRAQTFIDNFIKNANENELAKLISLCKNKMELLKTESQLKALSEKKKFDLGVVYGTSEFRALRHLEFKAENEQKRRNIGLDLG